MTNSIDILLISILFCMISSVLAIMLKRSNNNKDHLLTEMRATLDSLQNDFAGKEKHLKDEPANIFDDNLRTAELTTRLQHPRLTIQQCGYSPATPERYRYIQSMVEKGMSTEEIASMLSMSLHETTQLVTLIGVAHHQHKINEKAFSSQQIADKQEICPETLKQNSGSCVHKQEPPARTTGVIKKSMKFARWLKGRATPYIRKQSGREPPPQPLPHLEKVIRCLPLSGYT